MYEYKILPLCRFPFPKFFIILFNGKYVFSVDNYLLTFMQIVIFVTNLWKNLITCDFLLIVHFCGL